MPLGPEKEEDQIRARLSQQQLGEADRAAQQEQAQVEAADSSRYPILGEDFLKEINRARPEELRGVAFRFMAAKEGLNFGTELYDLSDRAQLRDLEKMFLTVEGGTARESYIYPDQALRNKLYVPVRKHRLAAINRENRSLEPAEEEEIRELTALENVVETREQLDTAYVQRMGTCQVAELGSELLSHDKHYRDSITPDRVDWEIVFKRENKEEEGKAFGDVVDRVLRRIVATGMTKEELAELKARRSERKELKEKNGEVFPGELEPLQGAGRGTYINYIKNSAFFKTWLEDLLKRDVSGGRMDIVWFAWKLALTWEIPAELGMMVDGEDRFQIAEAPVGNDFFVWSCYLDAKRTFEYGLDQKGMRYRFSRYLTHSGYPISLGKLQRTEEGRPVPLLGSFLREASVEENVLDARRQPVYKTKNGRVVLDEEGKPVPKTKKVSLWKLWWERGTKLGDLPWFQTDIDQKSGVEEFPTGSFGYWLLQRTRAFPIIQDIRSRPSLRDISEADFFGKRVRNWDKIFGPCKDDLPPEENPRTWWVTGFLLAHSWGRSEDKPLAKKNPDKVIRSYYPDEAYGYTRIGEGGKRPISITEIFDSALQSGFLRQVDVEWIRKELKIQAAVL